MVATDLKNGIGKKNSLPWRLPSDLKFFQKTTIGTPPEKKINAIVMGRKTWESLPPFLRPLKNRKNTILSRKELSDLPDNISKFSKIETAIETLSNDPDIHQIFIIGGGQIYKEAIQSPECIGIYRTHIQTEANCDTFFPDIPSEFKLETETPLQEENNLTFSMQYFKKERSNE